MDQATMNRNSMGTRTLGPTDVMHKKAELILAGTLVLHDSVKLPFPLSKSTAGPGAGQTSIMIGFQGTRVKLQASRDCGDSPFMVRSDQGYSITKFGRTFLDNVDIIPIKIHAPNQAFINIDATCRFGCLFCSSPDIANYVRPSNDWWIERIITAANEGSIESIAITSGIPTSIEDTIEDFIAIMDGVRDLGLPIGVEPYVDDIKYIDRLWEGGASELKLNIQSMDRGIFDIMCPHLEFDIILKMLSYGVTKFGKNRVSSNIIIGVGETDDNVVRGLETLAGLGVAGVLRTLHLHSTNKERLHKRLNIQPLTKERLLYLHKEQTRIFLEHGLETERFKTMCFPCKGCDLEIL